MALDLSGVGCVSIGYNNTTEERTYALNGYWNPSSCYDQVLMPHTEFRAIVEAAGSGASSPEPSTSAFTEAEVVALKYQAANPSPFNLSIDDGVTVSYLMLLAFAIAWGFRVLARSLSPATNDE